jgi:solute carrier family 25 protein 33/36
MDCVRQTLRQEGARGFYRGLSASYIGTLETAVQWVFYEHLKATFSTQHSAERSEGQTGAYVRPMTEAAAAGASKLVAAIALYPHEVRCRMARS